MFDIWGCCSPQFTLLLLLFPLTHFILFFPYMVTIAFNQFDSHQPLLSKITCPLLVTTFLGSHHPARYRVLDLRTHELTYFVHYPPGHFIVTLLPEFCSHAQSTPLTTGSGSGEHSAPWASPLCSRGKTCPGGGVWGLRWNHVCPCSLRTMKTSLIFEKELFFLRHSSCKLKILKIPLVESFL